MGRKLLIALAVVLGLAVGGLVVAGIGLGVALELGAVPDTRLRAGDELRAAEREAIATHVGLEEGEQVVWYYSAGLFDHGEDMNLITDRRVVSRTQWDGAVERLEARYEEIVACEVVEEGHVLLDTTVFIRTDPVEDLGLVLYLSAEEGLDREAIAFIRGQIAGLEQ